MAQNGKSSLKAPNSASLNGNEDGSDKSRKGKRVQFDAEDIMDNKFDMRNGNNSSNGKGGKGDKAANGGKPTVSKGPLLLKVDQVLPKDSKCLMDCEAAEILQGIDEQMIILSEDPSIKIPTSFVKGLKYAKNGTAYTNPQAVRKALEPLKKHGVSEGEMCMIANISSESVDEVFAVIPSLKGKRNKLENPLKEALTQLAMLKKAQ